MRPTCFKRPLLTLGGVGLVYCLSLVLKSGNEWPVMAGTDLHTSRIVRSFLDLEANVSDICEFRKRKKKYFISKTSKQELG